MKKSLFLLIAVLGFSLSGCLGGTHYYVSGYPDLQIKEEYSDSWDNFLSQNPSPPRWKACKEGQVNEKVYRAWCNDTICRWRGFKETDSTRKACRKQCLDVKKSNYGQDCKALHYVRTTLAEEKGWKPYIDRIKDNNALCTGDLSISDFVINWERINKKKCKDSNFDCIEKTFDKCQLHTSAFEWLNREKIEEQYNQKKTALCSGKLHARPYKLWFEWNVCKKFQEVSTEFNHLWWTSSLSMQDLRKHNPDALDFSKYTKEGVDSLNSHFLPCSEIADIYLKAEKESCE